MVRARKGPHGGKRQGAPGANYSNRADMQQAPRAVPGQTYGDAGAQLSSQQIVPLPAGGVGAAGGGPAAQPAPSSGAPLPGPIDAPTGRPGEPLTTGIAGGAGAGPEVLGMNAPDADPTVATLKGILARYPNPDLQDLVTQAEARLR